ncbi:MAG TPA: hypothetical protein VJJ75_02295 [Candidatus Nanoarchaeia archaeon]|nr:hypothetical protein [Candidatus Nanoarchaeia archaeon]
MAKIITIWRALEPMLYSDDFTHLADIARKLRLHHTTVRKYLGTFEEEGIIIKKIKGRLTLYKLNEANPLLKDYLQIIEKERLVNQCLENKLLREIVGFFHAVASGWKVVMFGSAVENIKKANDIDILLVGNGHKIEMIAFYREMRAFKSKWGIDVQVVHCKDFSEVNKPLKREIRKKHLFIEGAEETIQWMLEN